MKGKIQKWGIRKNGRSKACIISNSNLVRFLNSIGVPSGDKVSSDFKIPNWIMKGKKEIQLSFIRRLMDCEGSIGYDKFSKRWEIRFTMSKIADLEEKGRRFLNDLSILMRIFGIETTSIFINRKYIRPKDEKLVYALTFKILKKNSIMNYYKYIGFDTKYKKVRLQKAINWAINGSG